MQRANQVGFLSRRLKLDNLKTKEMEMIEEIRSLSPMLKRKNWSTTRSPTKLLPMTKPEHKKEVVVLFLNRTFSVLNV